MNWIRLTSLIALALVASAVFGGGETVVDPSNPEWLEKADGTARICFGPGDPEHFFFLGTHQADGTWTGGDQQNIIDQIAAQGGNCIYIMAVKGCDSGAGCSLNAGDGAHDGSRTYANPWTDGDPANGLDTEMMAQWEGWLDSFEANGITVYFFIWDDSQSGTWTHTGDSVPAGEQTFLEALVDEFDHHLNLVWVIAEEYNETWSATRVVNQASIVRAADDQNSPIGVHQIATSSFNASFRDDSNIDIFMIQCDEPSSGPTCDATTTPDEVHESVKESWDESAGRYALNMSEIADGVGIGSPRPRQLLWASFMSGASWMSYGWFAADVDPYGTIPDARLNEQRWAHDFVQLRQLQGLAPDDTRANSDTDYVLEDDTNLVYMLYADSGVGNLGLTSMTAGDYDLYWLDTADGDTVTESNQALGAGTNTFSRPGTIGAECALWIEPAMAGSARGTGASGASIE